MSGPFISSRTAKVAGWVLVILSIAGLVIRYLIHRNHAALRAAESRQLAPAPKAIQGAWWYTGEAAPADQASDLTGVWSGEALGDLSKAAVPGGEMVLTPYGQQRFAGVDHSKNPTSRCLPPGPSRIMLVRTPVMIVQRADVVLILSEGHRTYRIIYTDGRGHAADAAEYPEWMGDSIGHWEQDTLVVDTVAVHEGTWLDYLGHEHSGQLHMVERLRLMDANTVEHITTFEDPVFFAKPFTMRRLLQRKTGDRILDSACMENEKDSENLVPTIGDEGR